MQTRKLYYEDPYMQQFTAQIVKRGLDSVGHPYVILDQTAFYPTGGGQPYDSGTIQGTKVIDVEEINDAIHHRLSSPLPDGIVQVTGQINWQRRFDHMQQHNGQHILSAAFETILDGATVGFHLGREYVTVDIELPNLSQDQIQSVEAFANQIVFDNRPIDQAFVDDQTLAKMPLRKAPTVTENIRIVTITEFDWSPCGGTHPRRTGEVGPIKILGWERNKGNQRVAFACGWRAIREMSKKQAILGDLTQLLSTGEAELTTSIASLINEKKEQQRALQESLNQLFKFEAKELLESAIVFDSTPPCRLVAHAFENRSMQDLQKIGQLVTATSNVCVILVGGGEKKSVVMMRSADLPFPMNEWLKKGLEMIGGKGGGQSATAQGGAVTDLSAGEVLQKLTEVIKPLLSSTT